MDALVVQHRSLDDVEAIIVAAGGEVVGRGEVGAMLPVTHRFTPGLYIREIFMPAGSVLTSKIHKTEHPFIVSKGVVLVYSDNDGVQCIEAPYTGVTRPGARRFLVIIEDTIWTTFHVTQQTDVAVIEDEIIEPHVTLFSQALLETQA